MQLVTLILEGNAEEVLCLPAGNNEGLQVEIGVCPGQRAALDKVLGFG